MSLANKHRPQRFDTIIGQEHITEILKAQMQGNKQMHHNFLLVGPRGTWKTTAARVIAKAINCLNLQEGNPCNECVNCRTINEGKTLDYVEIDAASHTGVDNIREEIIDKAQYPPTSLKKRIYVIDEFHMLSKWASNALLKSIEEPKTDVCFILATTEIHKVLETIVSRCQVFNFKKVAEDDMVRHLEHICVEEGILHSPSALQLIARISEWCVRDAVKYVDQVGVLWEISEEHIMKFLGVASETMIDDFLSLIRKKDRGAIFHEIDLIHHQGVDLYSFAKQVLLYVDQHFLLDVDFLVKVAEAFTEIISTIKYYPYPTVVYKVAINKHMWLIEHESLDMQDISHTVDIHPKISQKDTQEQTVSIDVSSHSHPNIQELQQPAVDKTSLLSDILSRLDPGSFRDNLQHQIVIDEVTLDKVKIIAINKIAEMSLKKIDHISSIQKICTDILGRDVVVEVKFENKETYFARKLW